MWTAPYTSGKEASGVEGDHCGLHHGAIPDADVFVLVLVAPPPTVDKPCNCRKQNNLELSYIQGHSVRTFSVRGL